MAVEGDAHDRDGREDAAGEVDDADGVGNHGVHDELLEDDAHGDQDGDDRQHRHVFERVDGWGSAASSTRTLHHAQGEHADKADRSDDDRAAVEVGDVREEERKNVDEKIA